MNLYSNKSSLPFTEKQWATVEKSSQPRSHSDLQADYVGKELIWPKTVKWNRVLLASSAKQEIMLLASKCEPGPWVVTCFKMQSGTTCYLLWSGTVFYLLRRPPHQNSDVVRPQAEDDVRVHLGICATRQVSFCARDTSLKNVAYKLRTKFSLEQCISWGLGKWLTHLI